MSELNALLKIMEKLQSIDDLSKRVEELEKQVEMLSKVTIDNKVKSITNSLDNPNATTEDKLVTAAELALEHFIAKPPMAYQSEIEDIKKRVDRRRKHE